MKKSKTKDPVLNTYGMTEDHILAQILSEYMQSKSALDSKRQQMQDNLRLYIDSTKRQEKVTIKMIYSQVRTLLALGYTDKSIVEFGPGSFDDMLSVSMWNKVQKFDYDEMDMDVITFVTLRDKLFYGVGIRCYDGWDEKKQCPIVSDRNPLSWLPDPRGWLRADDFRWHGFESKITKYEAKVQGYKRIGMLMDTQTRPYGEQNYYDNIFDSTESVPNAEYNVYHHFTKFDGCWYLATTSGECSTLHRFVKIEEVMGYDCVPISLFYYSPERFNPYGTSVTDLTEDNQRAISELLNLAIARAKRSSLGSHIAYDSSMINENDMINLSIDPKTIPVDTKSGQKNIQSAIFELPRTQVPQDNQVTTQRLEYYNRIATGLDPSQFGVGSSQTQTATEVQQNQSNANIIYSLVNSINFRGEKDFWNKYIHMYTQNFRGTKFVRLKGALGMQFFEFNKSQLKTKFHPDIVIKSAQEKKIEDKNMLINITPFLPNILPKGGFAADYTMRRVLQLAGVEDDESMVMIPRSADEIQAFMNLELINRNENLAAEPDIMNEDHDVYIAIYSQANDTPAKMVAIQGRLMAKIEKSKLEKQQAAQMPQQPPTPEQGAPGAGAMGGTTQNMSVNNLLQSGKKGVVSAQDTQV